MLMVAFLLVNVCSGMFKANEPSSYEISEDGSYNNQELDSYDNGNITGLTPDNSDAEYPLEPAEEMEIDDNEDIYTEQISTYAADSNYPPMPTYDDTKDIAIIFVCTKNNSTYVKDYHTKYMLVNSSFGQYFSIGKIEKSNLPEYEYMCEFILDIENSMNLYRKNTSDRHCLYSLAYSTGSDRLNLKEHFYFYWDRNKWVFPYWNPLKGQASTCNYGMFVVATELTYTKVNYTIVRNYYFGDVLVATERDSSNNTYLEEVISADTLYKDNTDWAYYTFDKDTPDENREVFSYSWDKNNKIITTIENNEIVLNFVRKQKVRVKFESLDEIEAPEDFYMECFYDDDPTVQKVFSLKDAEEWNIFQPETLTFYQWETIFPSDTNITFKAYNFLPDKYEFIGIDSTEYVVKKDKNTPSITLRPENGSEYMQIKYLYNYVGDSVDYRVEWYDKQGNELKRPSYRSDFENVTVVPESKDFIIEGWVFDKNDERNILSKQLETEEENVLKLYFYKFIPTVNLHFNKTIEDSGEAFDKMMLDKEGHYDFCVMLKNQDTGETIKVPINNKNGLTVMNVPFGIYEIKEIDGPWFKFVSMIMNEPIEGIELKETNGTHIITISTSVEPGTTANIDVINKIDEERFYDSKYDVKNFFNPMR